MIRSLRRNYQPTGRWLWLLIVVPVLFAAAYLGQRASAQWLGLIVAVITAFLLLKQPDLGLSLAVMVALFVRLQVNTGSEVKLTAIALFIPFLAVIWLLDMVRRRGLHLAPSGANLPLFLFLLSGLMSLLIGNATWDLMVPRGSNFLLVQLAQWAIFAFSALAFWLTANLITDEAQLTRLTWVFLWLGGILALASVVLGLGALVGKVTTVALVRSPFWVLLTGLAGGQLLFNPRLSRPRQMYLALVLAAIFIYAFIQSRQSISNWIGFSATMSVLLWLRFPRLRWPIVILILAAALAGILFPTAYDFAGGDAEWEESGGSRLVLIERVVEVTLRNPITGLGPAAYRPYTAMKPLPYGLAYWVVPQINSHNNYIDLFSHTGLLGLGLFLWFAAAVLRSAQLLRARVQPGFRVAFLNGMLAAWIGALVIMMLADWILPFVYNIGFEGFPASVLIWLFLGGLVALQQIITESPSSAG